ncbi:hypothetical protein [Desulfoluna sp.]|uniref:hypothetical protein n=1 Tax=Desulfoluna sp. TaxID=2045199 RepID=UPI0026194862|nr:hypothetical protein [Desulfoluna sp.]
MKRCRRIRSTVCLFCLFMASGRAFAEGFDFRNVRWGMNRFEVMASEDRAPKRMRNGDILYRVPLFKRPAYLMYRLAEDRLVGARYVLPLKRSDTLERLEALVSLRYGALRQVAASEGMVRVWESPDRTVRLFLPKKGQAVIDVVSEGADEIPLKVQARRRRDALREAMRNL